MKLTSEDKKVLKGNGYSNEDMIQIEKATTKTAYEFNGEKISQKKALEILGRREYLSGIARSSFHWSSVRNNDDGEKVYFDSSRLFSN